MCAYFAFSSRSIQCVVGLLGLLIGAAPQWGKAAETQPNIVFIMADDLGWADVEFHGGQAPTPNLSQLAATGLELTQHYVAPVCSPTRTGLLTGRCWSRFGVVNPQNEQALPMGTTTLASALRSAGYATCLTGKWHLGSLPEWGPNHFGFEHAYGSLAGGVSPWNHFYKKGPYSITWNRNETLLEEPGHVTDLIAQEAIQWIEARDARPFFLYVPFTAVHLPVKEPEDWVAKVPDTIQGEVARHYAASIMHLDDAVGKIIAAVNASGKRDNTLIVFTSDNGGSTAENNDLKYPDDHCPTGPLPGNNAPLRGQKGTLYEGGIRVPTIVHWPGKIQAASRPQGQLDSPVQITDWMPTLCELAGFTSPQPLKWDGQSLVQHLLHQAPLGERALYSVGPNWKARALRYGPWKLIATGDGAARRVELYNLHQDPTETHNLAESHADQLSVLLKLLQQQQASDRDALPAKISP